MKNGTVYLLKCYYKQTPVLKIGFTQNRFWDSRSKAYETCGLDIEVLGELDACYEVEQYLHTTFNNLVINNEFFLYDKNIIDCFTSGVFFKGKLYKPWIENYNEIHKQISTFDLLENIKFKNINIYDLWSLCNCNNFEYHSFDGVWKNYYGPINFKPGYIYFDITKENKISRIIFFRAPKNKKTALLNFKDEFVNKDIQLNEFLYWSDMSLNGFIKLDSEYNTKKFIDLLIDIRDKKYECKNNTSYLLWCMNKKIEA